MPLSSSESSIFSDTDYDGSSEEECSFMNTDENIKNVKFFHKIIIKLFLKNRKYYEQVKKIALSYISKIEDTQFSHVQNSEQGINENIYNFYFDTYDAIEYGENKLIYYMQNNFHKFIDVMNNYSIPFFFRLIFLSCYFEFLSSKEIKKDIKHIDGVNGYIHSSSSDIDNGESDSRTKGENSVCLQRASPSCVQQNSILAKKCFYNKVGEMGEVEEGEGVGEAGESEEAEKEHVEKEWRFRGSESMEEKDSINSDQSEESDITSDKERKKGSTSEEDSWLYDFIDYDFNKERKIMEEIDLYSACLIKGILYSYRRCAFLKDVNTKIKINNCFKMIFEKQNIKIMCRVVNVPYLQDMHINCLQEIRSKHIGKFVSTEGIITRVGEKKILEECKKYRCMKCDNIIKKKAIPELYYNTQTVFKCQNSQINTNIPPCYRNDLLSEVRSKETILKRKCMKEDMVQEFRCEEQLLYIKSDTKNDNKQNFTNYPNNYNLKRNINKRNAKQNGSIHSNNCHNKNPYIEKKCNGTNFEFLESEVKRVDYQEIKIKESSKTNIPYSITVVLLENLAGKYHPGKKVIINGIILRRWKKLYKDIRCDSELFIEANNIEVKELEVSKCKEISLDDEFSKCINNLASKRNVCDAMTNRNNNNSSKNISHKSDVNNYTGDPIIYDEKENPLKPLQHIGTRQYPFANREERQQQEVSVPNDDESLPCKSFEKASLHSCKISKNRNKSKTNTIYTDANGQEKNLFEKYWLLFKNNKLEGKRYICDSLCPNLYNSKLPKISVLLVLIGGNRMTEQDSFYNQNNRWKKYFSRGSERLDSKLGPSDGEEVAEEGVVEEGVVEEGVAEEGVAEEGVVEQEVAEQEVAEQEVAEQEVAEQEQHQGRGKYAEVEMEGRGKYGSEKRRKHKNRKGRRNFSSDSCNKRTLCHLLLVGDPGTGKSQLLKEVQKISYICMNVSGMFCTTAGLTCAAIKEGNNFMLESGALVLADNGVCCIDEFCLMKNENKNAIHEAMEQLTISVAKGGIVDKLNCRCTIIGASNFELHKTVKGNLASCDNKALIINLSYALLSRFDMVVITEDNSEIDSKIADYVLAQDMNTSFFSSGNDSERVDPLMKEGSEITGISGEEVDVDVYSLAGDGGVVNNCSKLSSHYCNIPNVDVDPRKFIITNSTDQIKWVKKKNEFKNTENGKIIWSSEKLREYIHHVKNNCFPYFNKNSKLILISYYSMLRKHNNGDNGTTIRTLESLIRLSEAHSKMMYNDNVSSDDVINIILLSELSLRGYKIAVKTNSNNVLIARTGIFDNLNDSLVFYNNMHKTFYSLDDVLFYESLYNYFKKLLLEKLNLTERDDGVIHKMVLH
ncbi:DNA helicase MCM9 [Plasmodium gonderi]|uniref:DNA helicase MCM9 n=1 Tax=Plasmodium gonderi TaxID=77519 RepID=A0A1Y1JF01_PLAGO|nr:DNA helicase MCM9 [Plasmodium gonderi]GAW79787.1 DNA helicase MCM9 [Plasmodium gonderi]